jgi:hypothetical protein
MSVNRDGIEIRLPKGVNDMENVVFRMADIWLWYGKDLKMNIPAIVMDRYNFKKTDFSPAKALPKTQSDYYQNPEYYYKKKFKKFSMGSVSDGGDIFPFDFLLQEDKTILSVFATHHV